MKGDELEDAIDQAVRGIMRAQPGAGLRQRVMQRIARPEPRPRALWKPALAAGLACCALLGLVLVRRGAPIAPTPVVSLRTPASRPVAGPPSPAVTAHGSVASAAPPVPAPPVSARRDEERSRHTPEPGLITASALIEPDDTIVVTPLPPLAQVQVTPADAAPVRIDAIDIAPLRMDPIRVEPLLSLPR